MMDSASGTAAKAQRPKVCSLSATLNRSARKVTQGECFGVGAVEGPSPADAGDAGPRGGLLEGGGWVVPEAGLPILPREVQEGPGPLGQGDLED